MSEVFKVMMRISRHPQCLVRLLFVKGGGMNNWDQCAGGGEGGKVWVSKNNSGRLIFKYICQSLLAFESGQQRARVSPACLGFFVSLQQWGLV